MIKELKIKDLVVSQGFSRPINMKWCKERATDERFCINLMQPIIVSFRDGKYYVVDGQSRVTMLTLRGIETVWCVIHEDLTYEEEAKLFRELNNGKAPRGRAKVAI